MENLINELRSISYGGEQFDPKYMTLRDNVERHVQEEESELFPNAERKLGSDELNRVSTQMEQCKQQSGVMRRTA